MSYIRTKVNKKVNCNIPKNIRIVSLGNNNFQIEYCVKILFWYFWKSQISVNGLLKTEEIVHNQLLNNNHIPIELVRYTKIKV